MAVMDLSGVVASLSSADSIAVHRRTPGIYTNGIYVPASSTTLEMRASVQPLRGKELEVVPEGLRDLEHKKFYTTAPLRTGKPGSYDADEAVYRGETYKIHTAEDWSDAGYCKAIGMKVET